MQNDSIDNLRLDLNKKSIRGAIYVRTGDTRSRTIHLTLVSNGTVVDLSDATICELLIKKPDGNQNDQTMVRYGNELQYTFRTQDVNVPGECLCQATVTFSDNSTVTSPEFSLMVYQKTISEDLEKSTNEYTALAQILNNVIEINSTVEANANRSEDAKSNIESCESNCLDYRNQCQGYASDASDSKIAAGDSEANAKGYRDDALQYRNEASGYAGSANDILTLVTNKGNEILGYDYQAKGYAESALEYSNNAKGYKENAANSATSASNSKDAAANSALDSEAYAVGKRAGADVQSGDPAYNNNSKYYSELAAALLSSKANKQTNIDTYYGTSSTAENTVEKTITISDPDGNFTLREGITVSVKFSHAVKDDATANINSTGAKAIYYKGSAITNGIISAGEIALMVYDGTNFNVIATDGCIEKVNNILKVLGYPMEP